MLRLCLSWTWCKMKTKHRNTSWSYFTAYTVLLVFALCPLYYADNQLFSLNKYKILLFNVLLRCTQMASSKILIYSLLLLNPSQEFSSSELSLNTCSWLALEKVSYKMALLYLVRCGKNVACYTSSHILTVSTHGINCFQTQASRRLLLTWRCLAFASANHATDSVTLDCSDHQEPDNQVCHFPLKTT